MTKSEGPRRRKRLRGVLGGFEGRGPRGDAGRRGTAGGSRERGVSGEERGNPGRRGTSEPGVGDWVLFRGRIPRDGYPGALGVGMIGGWWHPWVVGDKIF